MNCMPSMMTIFSMFIFCMMEHLKTKSAKKVITTGSKGFTQQKKFLNNYMTKQMNCKKVYLFLKKKKDKKKNN